MNSSSGGFTLSRFQYTSKSQDIYEAIREGIVKGYWKPGDKMNDQELAAQLGASRTSVREALAKMVESRIVENIPWKGYSLRGLDWQEIDSIIELRIHIEELALQKAMQHMTPEILAQLEQTLREADHFVSGHNLEGYREADFRFHELIYEASGNLWIPEILGKLRIFILMIGVMTYSHEGTEGIAIRSLSEHKELLERIRSGDIDRALQALREHLLNARGRVKAFFSSES